jgi:hypothetical protein
MRRTNGFRPSWRQAGWATLIAVPALLTLLFLSVVSAQETPEATAEATPNPQETMPLGAQETPADGETPDAGETPAAGETVLRLEVSSATEEVKEGGTLEVVILVDNVEHMAGFDVAIAYDADRVEPVPATGGGDPSATPLEGERTVEASELGALLETSDRAEGLFCPGAIDRNSRVIVNCVTTGPPVCAGGPPGASGSGLLGRVTFRAKGGGEARFEIVESTLALDDLSNCEEPVPIDHSIGPPVTLELKGDSGSSGLLIGIIVAVVVILAVVGVGGYFFYQRRGSPGGV